LLYRKYGTWIITNSALTIILLIGITVSSTYFLFIWNLSTDLWTKLGTVSTIIGTVIALYIASLFTNNDRIKNIQENHHYKISLLHDLEGILTEILRAIQISIRKENGKEFQPNDNLTLQENLNSFTYWASRITSINSNTYVPPYIRDAVSMLLHQGVKPITFNGSASSKKFVQTTVLHILERIIDSSYMGDDKDPSVQHFLKMVISTRDNIEKLYDDKSIF
jgi:protoheme ferro-lyase